MKKKDLFLLALIGLLVAVPVVLVAQAWMGPAEEDDTGPTFLGGSGAAIPVNAVEVVQAGPDSTRIVPGEEPIPLAESLRKIIPTFVGGTVFTGPAELVVRGGVSYYVSAGAQVRCEYLEDGSAFVTVLTGVVYAKNRELTLLMNAGGHITSSPLGRFTDLSGVGEAWRDGERKVPCKRDRAFEDLHEAFRDATIFTEIPATQAPISPSGAIR